MKTILDIGCNDLAGFNFLKNFETINEEDRKINGSYYTPTEIVSYIVKEIVI